MFCILDIGIVLLDVLTERVNLEKMCTEFGLVLAEAGFSFFIKLIQVICLSEIAMNV